MSETITIVFALLGFAVNVTLLVLLILWMRRLLTAIESIARSAGAGQHHLEQIRHTSVTLARVIAS